MFARQRTLGSRRTCARDISGAANAGLCRDRVGRFGVEGSTPPTKVFLNTLGSSSQFKNNYFTEMYSGSEAGSYLRLIDFCITKL